jgi:inner membrane protein
VQWKDAFVSIAVNDLRGTREALMLDWGGSRQALLPGSQVPGYTTGAIALLGSEQPLGSETQFSIPLDFNGSEGIYFAPFGVQNEATLKSNWPDPAFRGAFLPADRSVRPDGFDAKWKVSYYGRDYPQSWTSRAGNERFSVLSVTNSRFGVQLCRFWTRIDMSNARSNTVCSFLCSFLQPSFSSKSRRDRKFIRFNI